MGHRVRVVDPDTAADELLPLLAAALAGGDALLPQRRGHVATAGSVPEHTPGDVALLLPTSGSTGAPKTVELTANALRHSARATHARLGGAGRWLLALPTTHVAGWQVLVRSLEADLPPAVLDPSFTPRQLARAVTAMRGPRRYTALVPTQLARLLEDTAATRSAADRLDAVLLGGGAAPSALLARARAADLRVVTTYGMTETSGGCVYDGRPLDGVRVRVDDDERVLVAGPVLARGYTGAEPGFTERDGVRWFRTADAGRLLVDGRLEVLGRLDDVIVTGGENVAPSLVEDALVGRADVAQCVVVGVPDERWGQAVTAVVVPRPGTHPTVAGVRAALRDLLPAAAVPHHVVVTGSLPQRGPGKPDRDAVADLARRALRKGG